MRGVAHEQAVIGQGAWDRLYRATHGSVHEFLHTHVEAFRRVARARLARPSTLPGPARARCASLR